MSNLRLVADQRRRPGPVCEPPETVAAGPYGIADPGDARAPRPAPGEPSPRAVAGAGRGDEGITAVSAAAIDGLLSSAVGGTDPDPRSVARWR